MQRSRRSPPKAREQKPQSKQSTAKAKPNTASQRRMVKTATRAASRYSIMQSRHQQKSQKQPTSPKLASNFKIPQQTTTKRSFTTSKQRVQSPSSSSTTRFTPPTLSSTFSLTSPIKPLQQKSTFSTSSSPSSTISSPSQLQAQRQQSQLIRSRFARIPIVANTLGLISSVSNTPESLLTQSTRSFITNNHSVIGSAANSSSSTLVSKVTNGLTPITLPHHSNIASNPIDNVPFYMPIRGMAMQKAKEGKDAKGSKKKGGFAEIDPGEEAFNAAGDVKKNLRNWLEHILQSKPDIHPLPEAAQKNEELFVKECQTRFARRLDQRSRYEQAKIILKQRTITQLPGELKKSALAHDPSLWSMRVMTPFSDPPRKRWLYDHYRIPYKATQHEIDEEDFLKKKYARL